MDSQTDYLGCSLSRQSGNITLDQRDYAGKILSELSFEITTQRTPLPMTFNTRIKENHHPTQCHDYRRLLGQLGYLRMTRPDLVFALSQLAKVNNGGPSLFLESSLKHCLGYLADSPDLGRTFFAQDAPNQLIGITDAAFKYNADYSSVGASLIYFGCNLLEFSCHTQTVLSHSAPEAELREVYYAARRFLFYQGLFQSLGIEVSNKVILTDSQTTIHSVERPVTKNLQHVGLPLQFLRQDVATGSLSLQHIDRNENFADNLTKQNDQETFRTFRDQILTPLLLKAGPKE